MSAEAAVAAIGAAMAKKRTLGSKLEKKRAGIGGGLLRRMPSKPKPVYEGRSRAAIPHGKRSDKMESKATKFGGKANAAQTAGKGRQAGKLTAKAYRFHGKADKASGKYQAKKAKKTPVSSILA